jgi:hypothetical protein
MSYADFLFKVTEHIEPTGMDYLVEYPIPYSKNSLRCGVDHRECLGIGVLIRR